MEIFDDYQKYEDWFSTYFVSFVVNVHRDKFPLVRDRIVTFISNVGTEDVRVNVYPEIDFARWPGSSVGRISSLRYEKIQIFSAIGQSFSLLAGQGEVEKRLFVICDELPDLACLAIILRAQLEAPWENKTTLRLFYLGKPVKTEIPVINCEIEELSELIRENCY